MAFPKQINKYYFVLNSINQFFSVFAFLFAEYDSGKLSCVQIPSVIAEMLCYVPHFLCEAMTPYGMPTKKQNVTSYKFLNTFKKLV